LEKEHLLLKVWRLIRADYRRQLAKVDYQKVGLMIL